MGNKFSTSNSVFVQLEQPYYYGGDTVRGIVALNVVSQVQQQKGIELKVTGYEKTQFEESESHFVSDSKGGHSETRYVTRYGKKEFFKVKVPLGPGGTIFPGQYQYGFAFALPPNLPSTFHFRHGTSSAEVVYKVKAECDVAGMFKSDIKSKTELVVFQRDYAIPRAIGQSAEADITFCCCLRHGHVSTYIDMDKDRYLPSEQAHVRLQVDNRSSEDFKAVEVKLKQVVTLRADFAHGADVSNADVVKQSYEGVQKYTALQGGLARHIPLMLPANVPPTTHGQLITCDYWVGVKLKGGMCVSDMRMKVPAVIQPPQPPPPVFSEPPPEWNPQQVYDPVAVQVPSAPPLPADALDPNSPFWMQAMGGQGGNGGGDSGSAPSAPPMAM